MTRPRRSSVRSSGSSALNVAVCGALAAYTNKKFENEALLEALRDAIGEHALFDRHAELAHAEVEQLLVRQPAAVRSVQQLAYPYRRHRPAEVVALHLVATVAAHRTSTRAEGERPARLRLREWRVVLGSISREATRSKLPLSLKTVLRRS